MSKENKTIAYLNQIRESNEIIEAKIDECESLYEMVTRITPVMKPDGVSSGGVQHDKIGGAVAKIADLNREIDEEIDRYVDLKRKVANELAKLNNVKHFTVLYRRYVVCQTFERIATEMDYTYRGVCYLHGRALQEFAKILQEGTKAEG